MIGKFLSLPLHINVPILVMAGITIIISFKKSYELFYLKKRISNRYFELGLNSILVWSGIMVIYSVFFFMWGCSLGAEVLTTSNEIYPPFVWGGVKISLIKIVLTFHFFMFALIIWFILRSRLKYLQMKNMQRNRREKYVSG
ncbi:hypothetical protein ACFL6L_03870 [candidate division KSB1 bacterium]